MSSGKTAVGRILADRLGVPFVDLDQEIERLEGKPVNDIFTEQGEMHFRKREREVLLSLAGGNLVLAVGGGAYTSDDNIALINSRARTVWLECPLAVCLERAATTPGQRPLFSDPEEMARLFKHRMRFYERAHLKVDSGDGSPEEIAERIISALQLDPAE